MNPSKLRISAAASSLLAAGSGHAAIIHSGPVGLSFQPGSAEGFFDLNNDATNDFGIDYLNSEPAKPYIEGVNGSQVRAVSSDLGLPVTGENVSVDGAYLSASPSGYFDEGPSATAAGDWGGGATGFVGLQLDDGGTIHYGWARFSYVDNGDASSSLTLVDFAYEDTPDTAILTGAVPEPGTSSLLAGAAGLLALRRRRMARGGQ